MTDPWIAHDGGGLPVKAETMVEIECEDGYRAVDLARFFCAVENNGQDWWHRNVRTDALGRERRHPDDIIAYRLADQEESK